MSGCGLRVGCRELELFGAVEGRFFIGSEARTENVMKLARDIDFSGGSFEFQGLGSFMKK